MTHRHRHHKKPVDQTALNARDARRKALLAKAAESSGLAENDLRIESLSWLLLGLDLEKQRLLRGEPGTISLWQDLCDRLTRLCPKATDLVVHFLYQCKDCRKESDVDPEPAPEPVKPATAVEPAPTASPIAPAPAAQATQAAPPKVISIHAMAGAPMAKRDESWRSYVEGERSGYRRFDIPKDF